MNYKEAIDLGVLLGALEEKIVALPEWETVRHADPKLWDACDDGYKSVGEFINAQQERIDAAIWAGEE